MTVRRAHGSRKGVPAVFSEIVCRRTLGLCKTDTLKGRGRQRGEIVFSFVSSNPYRTKIRLGVKHLGINMYGGPSSPTNKVFYFRKGSLD